MIKRIIVLGDSYTFGHGCSDRVYYYDHKLQKFIGDVEPMYKMIPSEYSWVALLQKKFPDIEVVNLSQPGHCNIGMFRNLHEYYRKHIPRKEDLIMFNGTFTGRIEIAAALDFENTVSWTIGWEFMTPDSVSFKNAEYGQAQKLFTKHLFNDTVANNTTLAAIFGAHAFAKSHNLMFAWSHPQKAVPRNIKRTLSILSESQINHIWKYDFELGIHHETQKVEESEFNQSCYAPDYHVNDLGHQIYFEKEILPLITKLNNE